MGGWHTGQSGLGQSPPGGGSSGSNFGLATLLHRLLPQQQRALVKCLEGLQDVSDVGASQSHLVWWCFGICLPTAMSKARNSSEPVWTESGRTTLSSEVVSELRRNHRGWSSMAVPTGIPNLVGPPFFSHHQRFFGLCWEGWQTEQKQSEKWV